MMRMEVRRGGYQYKVHFLGCNDFLIGVRTFKELCRVNRGVALCLLQVIEVLPPLLQLVGEEIGKGGNASPGILHESRTYSGAAASAAKYPKANLRVRGRAAHKLRFQDGEASHRGSPQEFSSAKFAVELIRHFHSSLWFGIRDKGYELCGQSPEVEINMAIFVRSPSPASRFPILSSRFWVRSPYPVSRLRCRELLQI